MKREEIAFDMILQCQGCDWSHVFLNTKKAGHSYQVNRRTYYAMRCVGGGHQNLKRLCYLMNLPSPVHESAYRKINKPFYASVKKISEQIMSEAVIELRDKDNPDALLDIGVSVDGTWQKRGFTSINGAVVAISLNPGKVVDMDAMSRFCQSSVNERSLQQHQAHYTEYLS